MKALVWTTAVTLIVGVMFIVDAARNWPAGSFLMIDPEVYRNVILSASIGFSLIGIGILSGLLTLHARAVGLQTRDALADQAEKDRREAAHLRWQEQARTRSEPGV